MKNNNIQFSALIETSVRKVFLHLIMSAVILLSVILSFCTVSAADYEDSNSEHVWEAPLEDHTDIMLISSHADDEQLFFAGILPYYTQVAGLDVQVVYATDHEPSTGRTQERLKGLWNVGVRNYPDSMGYADLYSETYEAALKNLEKYGVTEDSIIEVQREMIIKYKPQVIVTHDVNGEYGHGMHKLVNGTLRKCLEKYGSEFTWLKKVYFHLYDENQIVLGFMDEAYDELGGRTPFQVTQEYGFTAHKSQHWTWFYGWIYGKNGNVITKASQIKTYNPAEYGLYYSAVGQDTDKNDFFEGLTSYTAQEEAARIAEEKRLEEERLEAERIAAEKAEAERLAEEQAALEYARKVRNLRIIIVVVCLVIASVITKITYFRNRRKDKESE